MVVEAGRPGKLRGVLADSEGETIAMFTDSSPEAGAVVEEEASSAMAVS